jgi:hypothetical protein
MASTGTLPEEEELWVHLPEELVLRVLEILGWARRETGAVRGSCRRWRAIHDASCKTLRVRDGVTDEVMHSLCGRMPELTTIDLMLVQSLTAEGLSAVGGLTALTTLGLWGCNVTDVGLQELTALTQLTKLWVVGCSTSMTGEDALKAAIPGLSVNDE